MLISRGDPICVRLSPEIRSQEADSVIPRCSLQSTIVDQQGDLVADTSPSISAGFLFLLAPNLWQGVMDFTAGAAVLHRSEIDRWREARTWRLREALAFELTASNSQM